MVLNIIKIEWHLIRMSPWTKRSGVEWVYSNNATAFYFYTQTAYFKNCVSVYFVSCTFLLVGFLDFANATLGMTREELIKKPKATDRWGQPRCRPERAVQRLQAVVRCKLRLCCTLKISVSPWTAGLHLQAVVFRTLKIGCTWKNI